MESGDIISIQELYQSLREKSFIFKKDLIEAGFPETQAKRVIRLAKKQAVKDGLFFYGGKQNYAPKNQVERIMGKF